MDLRAIIRAVPDFPQPGILFRDITPLLADPAAFRATLDGLRGLVSGLPLDRVAAIESRGFLFGAPLAATLDKGLAILRKPGKLPAATLTERYALEYGEASLQVHADAIAPGERVLVVDDLLATGGTAAAAARLIRRAGGTVAGHLFVVELSDLDGQKRLTGDPVFSLVTF